jgi:hypothetical protein
MTNTLAYYRTELIMTVKKFNYKSPRKTDDNVIIYQWYMTFLFGTICQSNKLARFIATDTSTLV